MTGPMLALALLGCIEIGIHPIDDTDPPVGILPVRETFVQAPLPGVDLLFVVDDTLSMAQEQAALADSVDDLADALDEVGVSWQIGVVTTDMGHPGAGWLRGSPYVLTSDLPDVRERLQDAVRVGIDGSAPEAGMAAAKIALSLAGGDGPNAGFRRPDAGLHVIFISDADDRSDAWLGPDPVASLASALAAEGRGGMPVRASAIVGDVPNGCVSVRGTAQAGVRYAELARQTGGALVSICAADLAPVVAALGDLAVAWPTRFPLRHSPIEGSVRLTVDDVEVEGWTVDREEPAVVFAEPPAPSSRIVVSYLTENA